MAEEVFVLPNFSDWNHLIGQSRPHFVDMESTSFQNGKTCISNNREKVLFGVIDETRSNGQI